MAKDHPVIRSRRLSDLGECRLVESLRGKFRYAIPDILTGIGDDAAALAGSSNVTLVTADLMVEGIHFDLSLTTFFQLGFRILAANVSDIFAMAGKPRYFLLSLAVPANYRYQYVDDIYAGIKECARKFGIAVIGGDTSETPRGLVLSGMLIGHTRKIILRSGARQGDGIFVTGTLGDSAMGLLLLKKRRKRVRKFLLSSPRMRLMRRHLMPEPAPLKKTSGIHSMIDVSDGLMADVSRICRESGVGAILDSRKIPLSRELVSTAPELGRNPLSLALRGGEDYALLFTAPSVKSTGAFRIGEITKKGCFIVNRAGRKIPFEPQGYEHFRGKPRG